MIKSSNDQKKKELSEIDTNSDVLILKCFATLCHGP